VVLALALGCLYPFLFPHPSGKEGFFRPVWSRPIPGPQAPGEGLAASFRAGRHFGFVRLDGSLQYLGEQLFGVALSDAGFINYPRVSDNFVFQDPEGRFLYGVRGFGYPVLAPDGGELYSVSTDLNTLKRLERDGEVLWTASFFSPVTSLALGGQECAAGLLDGTVKIIDAKGRIAQDITPAASRIPVVLGLALRQGRLAVLSGIDPQRLSLLSRKNGSFETGEVLVTGSDLRREALVRFTADGGFLAYETEGGLVVRQLGGKAGKAAAELPGRLLALDSSPGGLLAVGQRDGTGSLLRLVRPLCSPLYTRHLSAGELFLRFLDGSLLVGFPGRLLRADYQEG
jgi:hypothetical protein